MCCIATITFTLVRMTKMKREDFKCHDLQLLLINFEIQIRIQKSWCTANIWSEGPVSEMYSLTKGFRSIQQTSKSIYFQQYTNRCIFFHLQFYTVVYARHCNSYEKELTEKNESNIHTNPQNTFFECKLSYQR